MQSLRQLGAGALHKKVDLVSAFSGKKPVDQRDILFVKGLGAASRPGSSVFNSEYISFHPYQCLPRYEITYVVKEEAVAEDIYGLLGRSEGRHLPRHNYMDAQADITPKMRAILVDWLVDVHRKYKLRLETLFLTVNLIDRFLDQRQTIRQKLQLVGAAAMLIASKFQDINPPKISDFVYITDNAYTKEDILQMEVVILADLKFDLCIPTPAHFMERYQRLNQCPKDSLHYHLLHYILELSLMDIQMIRYEPSHLVAAATLMSNKLMKQPAWPPMVSRQCKFDLPAVKDCAEDLFGLLEAAQKSPMQAVRKKFSHEKYCSVATRSIMCGGLLV